jgi:hypothetical protein
LKPYAQRAGNIALYISKLVDEFQKFFFDSFTAGSPGNLFTSYNFVFEIVLIVPEQDDVILGVFTENTAREP